METRVLGTTEEELKIAGEMLREGKLVAFPTETVYGLGADALNADAVKRVYEAKGRPSDNPMIVHVAKKEEINLLTDDVSYDARVLMDSFWPGPLTIVFKAKDVVPKTTTGGLDTVAVRMPKNHVANRVIAYSETPIAAPSANISGKPSPTKASHVIDDLYGKVDLIIDGEDCEVGIESTVIDMTGEVPTILRPGIITKEEIEEVLKKEVVFDENLLKKPELIDSKDLLNTKEDFHPKSPGMKYKHYAPNAEMIIYSGDSDKVSDAIIKEKEQREAFGEKVEVLIFNDDSLAAHDFFDRLRACDKKNVDVILVKALPMEGVGFSVMNRMLKSAGYNVVEVE